MVHSVAAQSGGRLTLKSVKGKGTTAEIWLPRDTSGQVSRPHGGMDRQAEVSPTAKALIVLVVDDDPLVLHNTTVALEDAGHEPDRILVRPGRARYARGQARGGHRGYRLPHARHERPAVCGESARSGRTCPILIASGYGDLSSSDLKLPKLQKPFTQHELLQVISATLNDADRDGSNVHVLRRRP